MGLREEIVPYLQENGLIRDKLGQDSKNGLCNLGLYYCTLVKRGEARPSDITDFERVVRSCYAKDKDGNPIVGLLRRSPTDGDLEERDDYKAILTAAYMLQSVVAREIHEYLSSVDYIVNWKSPGSPFENSRFNWTTIFGKDLSFVAHANFCDKKVPSLVPRLAWTVATYTSGITNVDDQDARKFSWLLIQPLEMKCGMCRDAAESWKERFKKDYPGGMKVVLGNYWNNHSHPVAKYFVD